MSDPSLTEPAAHTQPIAADRTGGARLADHIANTGLLDAELPDKRFVDERYLAWLYDDNPFGGGYYDNVDDEDGTRIAHYALIPQTYRNADGQRPFVFSLNAVSRSGSQRRGFFGELGGRIWGRAGEQGVQMIIGVTNDKSTGAVKKNGWRVVGPIPVKMILPTGRPVAAIAHHPATPDFLGSPEFELITADLDRSPAWHWTNCWTPDHLRWRLSMPTASYVVHVGPELVAVSTRTEMFGIPVAVILKLLPRAGRFGPLASRDLLNAICRHHRAPCGVYAGHNRHVPVRGIRLPERLKPVPLNLDILGTTGGLDQQTFQLDTFEFLDMDAY
jgi:hypothetical protein